MKMRVQLVIEDASGASTCADIAVIERHTDDLIGLSLGEAKAMTGAVQRKMVEAQARETINRGSICSACKQPPRRNGKHRVSYRTPFGRLDLDSPRFYHCRCQTHARQSISPLAVWLGGHISPELQYLEAQFAALLPYGVSAHMLGTVLPLERATSVTTWKRHVATLGARLDREAHERIVAAPVLNEFGLPKRNPLQAIGIDGGYVKAADAPSRHEGWFEVMVGKSLPRAGTGQVFAFVHRLEARPPSAWNGFWRSRGCSRRSPRPS